VRRYRDRSADPRFATAEIVIEKENRLPVKHQTSVCRRSLHSPCLPCTRTCTYSDADKQTATFYHDQTSLVIDSFRFAARNYSQIVARCLFFRQFGCSLRIPPEPSSLLLKLLVQDDNLAGRIAQNGSDRTNQRGCRMRACDCVRERKALLPSDGSMMCLRQVMIRRQLTLKASFWTPKS